MRLIKLLLALGLVIMCSGVSGAVDVNQSDSEFLTNITYDQYSSSTSTDPTDPPSSPVNLIFIHHSTGENWLDDENGGLGLALLNNNYHVSDTNYGWGPDAIGDRTDIGNWWEWFRGSKSTNYLNALYNEMEQHSSYSRLSSDSAGENEIIMFKSCFPNSALKGSPNAAVPLIGNNLLKGESCGADAHTVANAKGIYIDLLQYFQTRQDKMFVVITAPPLTDATYASNARAFNQWLVNDWLKNYPYHNVFVFDFYNVLTTNGGNSNINDLLSTGGNHHRWWNNTVQHQVGSANTLAYPSGDDHPSQAGNLKATAEFVPLLNYAYHLWKNQITTTLTAHATPAGGLYSSVQSVIISTSQPATVYYTTNGSTPTFISSKYTSALVIGSNTTLKYLAIDNAGNQSLVYSENYTIEIPPTITCTIPVSNATGVSLTSPVVLTFSENIMPGANYSGIYIKNMLSGALVSIASKTINGNTLTIKQTNPRKNNTLYKVYLPAKAVKDATGNGLVSAYAYTFTTIIETIDTTPPTVTISTPVNDATGVSLTSPVVLTFSENILAGTKYSGIYIKNLTTGKIVSIASKTIKANVITIKQTNNRLSKNKYQVYLPAGSIKDATGNIMISNYSYQFKTI